MQIDLEHHRYSCHLVNGVAADANSHLSKQASSVRVDRSVRYGER